MDGQSIRQCSGLDLTPVDTEPPTLLAITDDRAGETLQQGETVTYIFTFSEPMDFITVGADDFGNAGSSAITIESVTQPLPDVVLVQVRPTTTGTLQIRIQEGAMLTDLAGNPLDTTSAIADDNVITVNPAMVDMPFVLGMPQADAEDAIIAAGLVVGTVTTQSDATIPAGTVISQTPPGGTMVATDTAVALVVSLGPSPYETWAVINAPGRTPGDDFDLDGVPNAIEFILGGDKDTHDRHKLPTATIDSDHILLNFVRDQASVGSGVGIAIEAGTDLATWPEVFSVAADTSGSSPGVTVTDNLDGTDTVTISIPLGEEARKFVRLKVTITP